MAAEAFSSVLKKGMTRTTFWNCQKPGIMLTPAVISLGKECIQEYRIVHFFMLISDISGNKEHWFWMVFLLVDFQ